MNSNHIKYTIDTGNISVQVQYKGGMFLHMKKRITKLTGNFIIKKDNKH